MVNNYGLLLLLASVFTGLVWLVDVFWLKPARRRNVANYRLIIGEGNSKQSEIDALLKESFLVDFSRSFFPIIFFILILRSFFYEPFRIPSGSMKPTLLVGDFIVVEKYSYGLRMPGFHQLLYETGKPDYGDVVVFRYPLDPTDTYIKRLVGLPGDKIIYRNKKIEIFSHCEQMAEDKLCNRKRMIKQQVIGLGALNDSGDVVDIYQERLGKKWHKILIDPNKTDLSLNYQWVVPEGYYFVMGDNRDKSNDSRFWGFVSKDDLVGKAVAVWLHLEFENEWIDWIPSGISFDTIGPIQ